MNMEGEWVKMSAQWEHGLVNLQEEELQPRETLEGRFWDLKTESPLIPCDLSEMICHSVVLYGLWGF